MQLAHCLPETDNLIHISFFLFILQVNISLIVNLISHLAVIFVGQVGFAFTRENVRMCKKVSHIIYKRVGVTNFFYSGYFWTGIEVEKRNFGRVTRHLFRDNWVKYLNILSVCAPLLKCYKLCLPVCVLHYDVDLLMFRYDFCSFLQHKNKFYLPSWQVNSRWVRGCGWH